MAQSGPRSVGDQCEAATVPRHTLSDDLPKLAWPQSRGEFAALVEAYAERLARFAFRQVGNLQDAEDVVQDVFVRAFADRSKRREISAVGPYLYRSVANACTDLLRKRTCSAVSREEVDMSQLLGTSEEPREAAQADEALRRAEALLGRLPKEQAEAIRLRVFDELRLREIADLVGCSTDTICSRLRYGFQKLRRMVVKNSE
jgi:RNA polymerase sigma-70 factor (ECF subfamily)